MSTKVAMTAADFLEMPDNDRFELVRGELVEMNRPNLEHGAVCSNVVFLLELWARQHSAGKVFSNDTGVITERDPDSVRGPDCMFVRTERLPKRSAWKKWLEIAPDLAVEVFSPSDRWSEVISKVGQFLDAGTSEVWVLVPNTRTAHVFRHDAEPVVLLADAEIHNNKLLPGFRCRVAEFFEIE
jgi:Uma2 family endonuclease